ncbi:hypothetical protein BH708_14260 [Brachybacterium sp. P6-10-X1]|uniref:ATP-grasp domain-containing protein n=1 Tax=Brachybacterium sp. P6-10-X1 TaxID=1903186 RepID=UPI000971B89B|nr:hypothetical protein [Brachybacterium sp. P6-10-X1]APX33685.1 hypothetical protein BH708_14260 [Brachybacterium sp. P6-10-X1]
MTRIGLVVTDPTTFTAADPHLDAAPLREALRRRGADAELTVWHDETVDWAAFDLLVLRSPWDYAGRPAQFAAWLERVDALTAVLNEPELVRWNMDKRYLAQLEGVGVPVVPTSYHHEMSTLETALTSQAASTPHVVVKPTVGAGARHTGLFARHSPAALELGRAILTEGGVVMLQPEVPELSEGREKALYVVDGQVTHAIAKGALLQRGGGLRGGAYQESPVVLEATAQEQAFAGTVLAAVEEVTGLPLPLYGRIDTVDSAPHGLVLLEAELFEPLFNLQLVPEVTEIFADAILARG